jgi:cytidylate kinase
LQSLRSKVDPTAPSEIGSIAENAVISVEGVCASLNGEDVSDLIRTPEIAAIVSVIATHTPVRTAMRHQQQRWIASHGGGVVEGRDIGTVVFPDAELKIFMTASVEVRAQRRFSELVAKGDAVTLEEISANLKHRDAVDSSRENSPLTMTSDYRVLDNSEMDRDTQFALAMSWADELFSLIS